MAFTPSGDGAEGGEQDDFAVGRLGLEARQ